MDPRTTTERLRVALVQWWPSPGRPAENLTAALDLVDRAAGTGADLVTLPELWPCGYDPATLAADLAAAAEPLDGSRGRVLAERASRHGIWLAAGSVPEAAGGRRYNTAVLYAPDGRLVARHRKVHRYGADESAAFDPGDELGVADAGEALGRVALPICFDGDFPENARALRLAGARLVVEAAAYEHPAAGWWDRLYPAHALANGQWWILTNLAGGDAVTGCFGRSRVISPFGDVVAEARAATPGDSPAPEILTAELDFAAELRRWDAEAAALLTERPARPPGTHS